jgi:hypothetical protein
MVWAVLIGILIGAVFVSVFDWAANLYQQSQREKWHR